MLFPDKDRLQKLFHKEDSKSPFEGHEKRIGLMLAKSLSLAGSGKFLEAIDEYYNAWNFFESVRAQEPEAGAASISARLLAAHEMIFGGIAKEIDLCCAGDRYNKAMYLYETLRLFQKNAQKYLGDSANQDYFKRMQAIYNSMIAIYKLHHPAGEGAKRDA